MTFGNGHLERFDFTFKRAIRRQCSGKSGPYSEAKRFAKQATSDGTLSLCLIEMNWTGASFSSLKFRSFLIKLITIVSLYLFWKNSGRPSEFEITYYLYPYLSGLRIFEFFLWSTRDNESTMHKPIHFFTLERFGRYSYGSIQKCFMLLKL